MKIERIELESHGHERLVFKAKRHELSILSALLANAHRHTPPHETTTQFRSSIRGMMKCIDKGLKMSAATQIPS